MNRAQARVLIAKTFTQAFDKGRFGNFAVNLLNRIDETKASAWTNQYIKDAFKSHVQRYERLGTYTSPENEKLDVLVVHLTAESKLERARTAIRNFVADHLKARDEKDAALVAFVSPTEKQIIVGGMMVFSRPRLFSRVRWVSGVYALLGWGSCRCLLLDLFLSVGC